MTVTVTHPGLLATIQDGGRYHSQKYGVIVGGAADNYSYRLANLLVGNDPANAAIEITMFQTSFRFEEDTLFAVTGGDLQPLLDGKPLRMWQPVIGRQGEELQFQAPRTGARAYVALAGGVRVPYVLNSRSTYLRANFGGYDGRPLRKGDFIETGALNLLNERIFDHLNDHGPAQWTLNYQELLDVDQEQVIRFISGNEYAAFTVESKESIETDTFTVTSQSDRMGCRLDGPTLRLKEQEELLSEAVTAGTIQVPANGKPIVLLADRQTTGGYPKIGQVISSDLPKLAQLRPDANIRFQKISHREAERILLQNEWTIHQMALGIRLKVHEV